MRAHEYYVVPVNDPHDELAAGPNATFATVKDALNAVILIAFTLGTRPEFWCVRRRTVTVTD